MINFKKTFGLAVALGVFFSLGADSLASENTTENNNQSLFEIFEQIGHLDHIRH